jgi:hypothetical protein
MIAILAEVSTFADFVISSNPLLPQPPLASRTLVSARPGLSASTLAELGQSCAAASLLNSVPCAKVCPTSGCIFQELRHSRDNYGNRDTMRRIWYA